ncbi:MAG: hypothetical protein RR022_03390 [Angelakisella sp.]
MSKQPVGCANCLYRRPASAMRPRFTVCHYLLDTGEVRGCSPQHCTRWRERPAGTAGWSNLLSAIKAGDSV